jgi:hypothetical protein
VLFGSGGEMDNLKNLRRALLTLHQADELQLQHIYGEMQCLWDAREAVLDFLYERGKWARTPEEANMELRE